MVLEVRPLRLDRKRTEKLQASLRADGVEQRVTIQPGGMRKLPFEPAAFDAAVSTYAMDHVNLAGSVAALAKIFRVLKPGGDFLLTVISKDGWLKFTSASSQRNEKRGVVG